MSNANDGHDTHPLSSQNAEWNNWCSRIDRFVELRYGNVMPPYQRDLVKRVAKGEPVVTPRPFIKRVCERTAREVVAVLSAGQTAE